MPWLLLTTAIELVQGARSAYMRPSWHAPPSLPAGSRVSRSTAVPVPRVSAQGLAVASHRRHDTSVRRCPDSFASLRDGMRTHHWQWRVMPASTACCWHQQNLPKAKALYYDNAGST